MKISRSRWSQLSILYKIIHRGERPTPSAFLETRIARLFHDRALHKPATREALEFVKDLQLYLIFPLTNNTLPADDTSPTGAELTLQNPAPTRRTQKKYRKIATIALKDLKMLDFHVASLYNRPPFLKNLKITLKSQHKLPPETLKSFQVFKKSPNFTRYTCPFHARENPDKEVKFLLNYIFRFPDFRPAQIDGILKILRNEDAIALLPTGSGKSIIFQLLALICPGTAIVVCPIISLIDDQVDNLQRKGITRVAGISASTPDKSEAILNILRGHTLITYVAPERFQIRTFRDQLKTYAEDSAFSIIAVDEAHCVSEWGHDFRTSYLGLAQICRGINPDQPLLALTGTASRSVLTEMQQDLKMSSRAILTPPTFDRPELHYEVVATKATDKPKTLEKILTELLPAKFNMSPEQFYQLNGTETMSGIIFCPHVSGEYGVTNVTAQLKTLGLSAVEYYGQQPAVAKTLTADDWATQKIENATKFKNNQVPLLVATKSFGMGVDKPNIRYTIHYAPPSSLEAYYQEAGRAGRDRETAYSFVIISNDSPTENAKLLDPATPLADLPTLIKDKKSSDDIDKLLFFHLNAFPGVEFELKVAHKVLRQLGNSPVSAPTSTFTSISASTSVAVSTLATTPTSAPASTKTTSSPRFVNLRPIATAAGQCEKSLHYLRLLGFVRDYTVNFATGEYGVELNPLSKTELDHLPARLEELLARHYAVVEPARRQALSEIIKVMTNTPALDSSAARDAHLRSEIIKYLALD